MKGGYYKYLWVYIIDPEKNVGLWYIRDGTVGYKSTLIVQFVLLNMYMTPLDTYWCFELQSFIYIQLYHVKHSIRM